MEGIFGPQQPIPGQTPGIGGEMSPIPGGPEMSPIPPSGDLTVFGNPQQPGFLSRAGSWIKENPLLAAGAGLAVAGTLGGSPEEAQRPPRPGGNFSVWIPGYDYNRQQHSLQPPADYFTYGQTGSTQPGEFQFFDPNTIGQPSAAAGTGSGGGGRFDDDRLRKMMSSISAMGAGKFADGGHSRGNGSGRDDTIEAMLSDGEYVMDAETVSMLGDGSNDEGAARLDQMREELRKHKGQNLAKGKFSADARRPMEYLKKGGSPRRMRKPRARYMSRGGALSNEGLFQEMARVARGER